MLKPSNKDEVRAKIASFMEKRRNQPKGYSSGCIFKNPPGASAGFLIDKAGLKGVHIGGARVSEIHANYIVNDGDATTTDIKQLIAMIRVAVWKEFGIELEEEVRIVG
jgi:UDP-N-acetylmuramate dehydrogenase